MTAKIGQSDNTEEVYTLWTWMVCRCPCMCNYGWGGFSKWRMLYALDHLFGGFFWVFHTEFKLQMNLKQANSMLRDLDYSGTCMSFDLLILEQHWSPNKALLCSEVRHYNCYLIVNPLCLEIWTIVALAEFVDQKTIQLNHVYSCLHIPYLTIHQFHEIQHFHVAFRGVSLPI